MSSLRERVEGLAAAWRKNAQSFEITCGDSEVEAAYYGCADELAAALAAEGPRCTEGIRPHQCVLEAGHYGEHEFGAAAPSLHKEEDKDATS